MNAKRIGDAEIFLEFRIQGDVARVIREEVKLDFGVAWPRSAAAVSVNVRSVSYISTTPAKPNMLLVQHAALWKPRQGRHLRCSPADQLTTLTVLIFAANGMHPPEANVRAIALVENLVRLAPQWRTREH